MAKTEILKSNIITIGFRQEKEDKDYGSCMWAQFHFDLDNYDLMIASDCGNFTYCWAPTPKSESFLHLMSRTNDDYLLGKLSDRSVIDEEETFRQMWEYMKELAELSSSTLDEEDMENLKLCCCGYDEREVADEVESWLDTNYSMKQNLSTEYLYDCIYKDYPADAKKIVSVFKEHVQPKIKELCKEREG